MLLIPAAVLTLIFWPREGAEPVTAEQTPAQAERRLTRLRRLAATEPERQSTHAKLAQELSVREKGLIVAENLTQAQVHLLEALRRIAKAQQPPLSFKSSEFGPPAKYGSYGQIAVTLNVDWGIEQLVNFLADLGSQPELLASTELQLGAARPKDKLMQMRITVAGLVPAHLVPKKEGSF
jgi:hypothetical protein